MFEDRVIHVFVMLYPVLFQLRLLWFFSDGTERHKSDLSQFCIILLIVGHL